MDLVIDIGNSTAAFSFYMEKGSWTQFKVRTVVGRSTDEYVSLVSLLVKNNSIDVKKIGRIAMSSVVPNLTGLFERVALKVFGQKPYVISLASRTNLISSSVPQELGTDLLANLAAAHNMYPDNNVMVVDFGTALSMSTVSGKGEVLGVAIAPGLVTAVNSLSANTAQLFQVELEIPESALGKNSKDSMLAGIVFGWAGIVKEMISRVESELGSRPVVIATGGLSASMAPVVGCFDNVDLFTTATGIRLIAELNG